MLAIPVIIAAFLAWLVVRRQYRRRLPARSIIVTPRKSTLIAQDGAVRSLQSARLTLSQADLERLWSPANLENLARTYWRFLSRVTLGLVRVRYGDDDRSVVLLVKPLTLLRFEAPEYVLERDHGKVTWRIRDGLLVARSGHGSGWLSVDVQRLSPAGGRLAAAGEPAAPAVEPVAPPGEPSASAIGPVAPPGEPSAWAELSIDVEVANFYPAIAAGLSTPAYEATQAFVHVLVTHAFLRSLATLALDESKVRRFSVDDAPGATAMQASDGSDAGEAGSRSEPHAAESARADQP